MENNKNKHQLPVLLSFLAVLIGWFIVFYQGVTTAIDVWSVSEIFTHCFLVVPCSFYFIFQKRHQILSQTLKPNYWLLPFLIGPVLVQLFGEIGDIKLFMHFATFTSLPLLIWMVIGNAAAKKIAFPLFFIVFSIPVGEQLIPFLQDITTNMAVPLLQLSNVPIFRNGFYLDIPEGRFLVAEACSGISFLIASVVFGCLYAYISFTRLSKQLILVAISIFIPIFANALRVYGIILTAHLTDMEYAAGADHIIYGGVFYTIIIFLLIIIGEKFRDKKLADTIVTEDLSAKHIDTKQLGKVAVVIVTVFSLQLLWKANIENLKSTGANSNIEINLSKLPLESNDKFARDWEPNFIDATSLKKGQIITQEALVIDYFIALYSNNDSELITASYYLYKNDRWSLLDRKAITLDDSNSPVVVSRLVSSVGSIRYLVHWYSLVDEQFTSEIKVKLTQTNHLLQGEYLPGAVFAFSLRETSPDSESKLMEFLNANSLYLDKVLSKNQSTVVEPSNAIDTRG